MVTIEARLKPFVGKMEFLPDRILAVILELPFVLLIQNPGYIHSGGAGVFLIQISLALRRQGFNMINTSKNCFRCISANLELIQKPDDCSFYECDPPPKN